LDDDVNRKLNKSRDPEAAEEQQKRKRLKKARTKNKAKQEGDDDADVDESGSRCSSLDEPRNTGLLTMHSLL